MSTDKNLRWIRTKQNKLLGFLYVPGSGLRALGIQDQMFELNSEWVRITVDAAKIAEGRFGKNVEIVRTRPK